MKLLFVFASIIVSIIGTHSGEKLLATQWHNFKITHRKQYENVEEERLRMKIFKENLEKIEQHNELYEKGSKTYTLGINQFGDMTGDEFSAFLNQYPKNDFNFDSSRVKMNITASFGTAPPSFDWRDKGIVTKVKNQGTCRSCWAFSAIGAIESAYAIKTGELVDLSEQDLVDCSRGESIEGCAYGGWPLNAMEYISKYGINFEEDYLYEARAGRCRFRTFNKVFKISAPQLFRAHDEEILAQILFENGPISVLIHAKESIQFYNNGLYLNEDCDGKDKDKINHAVVAVGYGISSSGQYWLLKNSWGSTWGENGYMLLPRNRNNYCGILTETVLPII